MGQLAQGLAPREVTAAGRDVETPWERGKGDRWHGQVCRALQGLDELTMALHDLAPVIEGLKQVRQAVPDVRGARAGTQPSLPT